MLAPRRRSESVTSPSETSLMGRRLPNPSALKSRRRRDMGPDRSLWRKTGATTHVAGLDPACHTIEMTFPAARPAPNVGSDDEDGQGMRTEDVACARICGGDGFRDCAEAVAQDGGVVPGVGQKGGRVPKRMARSRLFSPGVARSRRPCARDESEPPLPARQKLPRRRGTSSASRPRSVSRPRVRPS